MRLTPRSSVTHVNATADELWQKGVPLTEAQFRKLWRLRQADLDKLPPVKERQQGDHDICAEICTRFSVLTGFWPRPGFPNVKDEDDAWEFFESNRKNS